MYTERLRSSAGGLVHPAWTREASMKDLGGRDETVSLREWVQHG
jgi:hypothetical protein